MKDKNKHKNTYKHISKDERNEIKAMLEKEYSLSDIARALGRSKGTISKEISRNSVKGQYNPEKADHKAYVRRHYASFRGKKIASDIPLRLFIKEKLEKGWSPETTAGRIRRHENNLPDVSKDTVYRFLKSPYGNSINYRINTRRKRKRTRKKKIKDRPSIEDRPKEAETRQKAGHWELDFVESPKTSKASLIVLVDRKTRFTKAEVIPNKKTALVNRAVERILENEIVETVTTDNDISLQKHEEMSEMIGADIYFCHPYASWEKGSVEEVNRRIRKHFPKGTDFGSVSQFEMDEVIGRINAHPRKVLDYSTPAEAMEKCLEKNTLKGRYVMMKKQKNAPAERFA